VTWKEKRWCFALKTPASKEKVGDSALPAISAWRMNSKNNSLQDGKK